MKLVWTKIDDRNWETQEPMFYGGFTIEKDKVFNHFVLRGPCIDKDGIHFRRITQAKEVAKLLEKALD